MSFRKWILPQAPKDAAAALAEACGIHPFLAFLLALRGITTPEEAAAFLGDEASPSDALAIPGMEAAAERIERALDANESIMIYGDYDVDGVTATVLLYSYLRDKGANVAFQLPSRDKDGYGLHPAAIQEIAARGVSLLITVDNGISAVEEVRLANEKGIDVVVTDHHQPQETLPPAVAVVDPHCADGELEFTDYAGVGVAFLLACVLEGDEDPVLEKYADLVALGTLADVMPLIGDNRRLVRTGLNQINEACRPGLKALAEVAGISGKTISSTTAAFSFAPRLNAAGRMASPEKAAQLLLCDDEAQAKQLAADVSAYNTERQKTEAEILLQIIAQLQVHPELLRDPVLVLSGANWHGGVIGIVAARMMERYGKPCIIISVQNGVGKGSGRSLPGFSLFQALQACASHLEGFGGHECAAGLTVQADKISEFRKAVNDYAVENVAEMPVPELRIDCKLRPSQISLDQLYLMAALEPFGAGNPAPTFGLFSMKLDNVTPIGGGKHLRLSVSREDVRLSVMKFHTTMEDFPVECGSVLNLAVSMERNEFRGVVSPQLIAKDIRFADTRQEDVLEADLRFEQAMRRRLPKEYDRAQCTPQREHLAAVYSFIRKEAHDPDKPWSGSLEQLWHKLHDASLSYTVLRFSLEILAEAQLLSVHDKGDAFTIGILPVEGKADLQATDLMKYIMTRE